MSAITSVSLVVPTWNEVENIEALLVRAHDSLRKVTPAFEIIVVDDSSADGTAEAAQAICVRLPELQVIRRTASRDLSQSVLHGWSVATGDVLAVIDADLQHPPERLVDLLTAMIETKADLAVASRNVRGGGVSEWALHRRIVSWFATLLATILIPGVLRTLRDPMSGFFAVRRDVLAAGDAQGTGYKILLEVLASTPYERLIEVPYVFEERKQGASKLGRKQVAEYLQHIAKLSMRTGEIWLFPKFALVGVSGMVVNAAFTQSASAASLALGFECSVLSNFLFNEVWTFGGRTSHLAPTQPLLRRLFSFQATAMVGLLVNLLTFALLRTQFGVAEQISTLAAILAGGVCNFVAATHLTWRPPSAAGVTKHCRRAIASKTMARA